MPLFPLPRPFVGLVVLAALFAPNALAQTLFFSEYAEGSAFNKAVEIYNPTGSVVDLSAFTLELHSNGSATPGQRMSLSGHLAPGAVHVVAHPSAVQALLDVADQTSGSVINFNGDDAVVLRGPEGIVDVIGQIGFRPAGQWGTGDVSTADNTLRRKAEICAGDPVGLDAFDPAAEWEGFASDTHDGFGSHTVTCEGSGPTNRAPVFTATLASQHVEAGAAFSFDYHARDPEGDAVTFRLLEGPASSTLDPATGRFRWTPARADAGASFSVRVGASDGNMTSVTSATLTVTEPDGAPVFVATFAGTLVASGATITYDYDAEDPDGGAVTYSLVRAPEGAAIDPSTGVFRWTVSAPGAYEIAVRALDDEGASTTATAFVGATDVLFPGETGAALRARLRGAFAPDRTMGYDVARDTMYRWIDRGGSADGGPEDVCGVYTGFCVSLPADVDPSSYLSARGINAEHAWPQSKGADREPARSDMHHLYPSKANVNSSRGNRPFGESPDGQTQRWFRGSLSQTTMPGADSDAWSESGVALFEPRQSRKGDVARSLLYFYALYEGMADHAFLTEQVQDLVAWNVRDTADVGEVRRTHLISLRQGNVNPFVIDPTLSWRAYADVLPQRVDCQDPSTEPSYAGGLVHGLGNRAFVPVHVLAGAVEITFDSLRGLTIGDPTGDAESGNALAGVRRSGGRFTFVLPSPAHVYFPVEGTDEAAASLRVTDACGRTRTFDASFTHTHAEAPERATAGLEASQPNPVRDRARIRFSLASAGEARLVLFDVLGREVAVLAEGMMAAGTHTAEVDASGLPAGVYVYRLTTGGHARVRSLVVTR